LRRTVDQRFDPVAALAGTGRYLALAKERFGRDDLAIASYHMGMGNLERVLADYGARDVSWAQLSFDSTPRSHPAAYARLRGLGDDSANYFWKVLAARDIMRAQRDDPQALAARALAQTAKNSA
jgi:soluble lytic murein transglycosylase-like protein